MERNVQEIYKRNKIVRFVQVNRIKSYEYVKSKFAHVKSQNTEEDLCIFTYSEDLESINSSWVK